MPTSNNDPLGNRLRTVEAMTPSLAGSPIALGAVVPLS